MWHHNTDRNPSSGVVPQRWCVAVSAALLIVALMEEVLRRMEKVSTSKSSCIISPLIP